MFRIGGIQPPRLHRQLFNTSTPSVLELSARGIHHRSMLPYPGKIVQANADSQRLLCYPDRRSIDDREGAVARDPNARDNVRFFPQQLHRFFPFALLSTFPSALCGRCLHPRFEKQNKNCSVLT